MGIGGTALYSVAYMAVRGLVGLVAFAARGFRWLGRAFFGRCGPARRESGRWSMVSRSTME